MNISVDDWRLSTVENDILLFDLFLGNGQRALLEVNPIRNPKLQSSQVPEIIVFCEMPGEKVRDGTCPGRWVSRPPSQTSPWSRVQLPEALLQQINQRLATVLQEVPAER